MTNTKNTKRALLSSVLALFLCFSMLLGTTFAWFTDSVTSGNNIIKSGNLDIELEYWNGTDWVDVAGKSDILTNTLWEPGVTEVAYLRVANAGSLALKYQLGINIVSETAGVNVAGDEFLLSEYIMFGVIEGKNGATSAYTKDDAGRAAAIAAVADDAKKISAGYTKADTMEANADDLYLALVVYMPTEVGNVANHNGTNVPEIKLGINVFATQKTSESDSFGTDYDDGAFIPSAPETVPEEGKSLIINGSAESKVAVTIPASVVAGLDDDVTSLIVAASAPIVDTTNKTVTFTTIELQDQNGNEVDLAAAGGTVIVTLPVGNAFADDEQVEVYHDGSFVTYATVTDGKISYEVSHFCEVSIKAAEEVVLDNTIDSVKEFIAFAAAVNAGKSYAGETVTLGADLDLAGVTWTPIGTSANPFKGTFDGNGKVIKNLSVLMAGKSNVGLFGFTTEGEIKNVTVENAKIAGRLNVGVVAGTPYTSKYTNITVKGHVEVDGMAYVGAVGGKNAYANWDNITVNVDEKSYVNANSVENGTAYRTYVGGVIGFNGEGGHSFTNITSNINVFGSTCDVGGAFGIAHYNNKFENVTVTGNVEIYAAEEAAEAEEIGGIAGVWHNETGYEVSFIDCVFNGKLTANVDADLSDNTITGKAYSATGKGTLVIINYKTIDGVIYAIDGVTGVQALYMVPEDFTGDTVVVAEGTSKLTNYAFAYNNSVKTVILASTVRDLGRGFDSAPSVEKVVLNEGLTTISSRAFKSTTALKEVVFSSTITEIADNAFQKSGIKEIVIPASVKTIGEAAFGSSLIETVTFEGDIAIQGYAFRGCTKLSTVNMNGYNVTFIASTLNNRNSCWFCNGESNNPNTSNITFNVKTDVIKDRVLAAMGAEKNNTPVNVEMTAEQGGYYLDAAGNAIVYDANGLVTALEAKKNVVFANDIKIEPAKMSNAYGATGINVKYGQTIDGNGYTLDIKGAGGTWDSGINTTGGSIKNLTVTGSFRGIFINHNSEHSEKVVLENVVIEGTTYTISCDQGLNQGIEATNCTFNGWTSFAKTAGEAKFVNCSFGEGSGYKYCRPYSDTEFVNCTFCEGYAVDTTRATVTFTDCVKP